MALTAEHIAKRVGCSVATVSRVLNNSGRVSDASRRAVLEAIQSLGAMPRLRGKRVGRTAKPRATAVGTVGILLVRTFPMETIEVRSGEFDIGAIGSLTADRFFAPGNRYANSYYRHIAEGALDELKRFGHRAVIHVATQWDGPDLVSKIGELGDAGLIVMGDYDAEKTVPFLKQVRSPLVSFITWEHDGWPDYVGIENARGIRMAFEHLRSLGHTRIGYVAGTQQSGVFRERMGAYRLMMGEAGFAVRPEWIAHGSNHIGDIIESVTTILRRDDRPTAMLCCYDGAALAVNQAADRLGIVIPRDLSIVGFDDDDLRHLFHPPLTSVRVPTQEMGRRAVQMLMMRRAGHVDEKGDGFSVRAVPKLIVRESTAPPTKADGR